MIEGEGMTRINAQQHGSLRRWLPWMAVVWMVVAASMAGAQDGTTADEAGCRFSDVPESGPRQADIVYACEQEWFQGYPDGTFRPGRQVPQHQIATVINRAFPSGSTRADLATFLRGGNPGAPTGSADFDDVAESHPQAEDIAYAVEQGWFQGYPDGTFRPDQTITPNQIVTVVTRAFHSGSTRADLAAFMRQGTQVLSADQTQHSTSPNPRIAYTVPLYDSMENQVARELWIVGWDGSNPRRLINNYNEQYQWSPDGQWIAYQVGSELWVVDVGDSITSTQLTDDLYADRYRWSPDGERIAYYVNGRDFRGNTVSRELWVMEVVGARNHRLASDVDDVIGGWWSPDGERILYRVADNWRVVGADGANNSQFVGRGWSPDGNFVTFSKMREFRGRDYFDNDVTAGELWIAEADGSDPRQFAEDVQFWRWAPDESWIAYIKVKDLGNNEVSRELWVARVGGSDVRQLSDDLAERWEWSPDGEHIAYEVMKWDRGQWLGVNMAVASMNDSETRQVADDIDLGYIWDIKISNDWKWAPDGTRIAYQRDVRVSSDIEIVVSLWMVGKDGSGERQMADNMIFNEFRRDKWQWSPNGERIAYEVTERDSNNYIIDWALWIVEADGSGARLLTDYPRYVFWKWSPSGDIIAYMTDNGLWVAGADGSNAKHLVPAANGFSWQPLGG